MVIGNTWFIDTLSIGFIAQFLYFIYTCLLGTFILFGMFLPVHKLSLFALFIHGYLVHFILFWACLCMGTNGWYHACHYWSRGCVAQCSFEVVALEVRKS